MILLYSTIAYYLLSQWNYASWITHKCFILFYIQTVEAFCLLIPEDHSQFYKMIPEIDASLNNLSIKAVVSRNMHKLSARYSASY